MKEERTLEFDWFDECVDLYFTQIDKQKEESKVQQKEAEIYKKMNRIKNDQLKRIEGLQKEQDNSLAKAKLLQNKIAEVQAIIEILTALQQSGLQWKEIWRMVKEEKRAGNPLANIIFGIDLEKKNITLMFNSGEMHVGHNANEFFDDKTENLMIVIDIDLSAQANIQKYFEIKKKTQEKEERTKDKANEAIKHAEDQARKALLKTRNEQKLKTTARKPFWFEKYDWFISSENYLIISGKNAQQNEEIVKTYLDKRDVYVHSEMAGSASCIIKNPSQEEVSPVTINETGIWGICHSRAWDMKVVTNAYWVWGDQVSKTPQSGEYLVTGSFMIRGKKNYINPARLELGCTLMFRLDDDSIANHLNERRNRTIIGGETQQETSKVEEIQEEENAQEQIEDQDNVEADEEGNEDEDNNDEEQEEVVEEQPTETLETEKSIPKEEEEKREENEDEEEGDKENENEEEEDKNEGKKDDKSEHHQQETDNNQQKTDDKQQKDSKVDYSNLPRGKKTKLKKRNKKYADQDDEDRRLAMEAIGAKEMEFSKKKKNKQENEQFKYSKSDQPKKNKQKDQKQSQNKQKDLKQAQNKQQQKDKKQKEEKPKVEKSDAKNEEEEKKEIEEIMKEENIQILGDKADISILDKLTGNPKPNDTLLYAIAM